MKLPTMLLAAALFTAGGAIAQSQPDTGPGPAQPPTRDQQAASPAQAKKAPPAKRSHGNKAAAKPKKGAPTAEPTRPAKPSITVAPAAQ